MLYDIYENNQDNSARFALGRTGETPLFIFGINPSTANDQILDATMKKVKGFASRNGFDGLVMLNIYPLRSPKSKDLPHFCDGNLCLQNIEVIQYYLQSVKRPTVWTAWGVSIDDHSYLSECLIKIVKNIDTTAADWQHCGSLTKLGHPRHPSRLPYCNVFQKFDLLSYIEGITKAK